MGGGLLTPSTVMWTSHVSSGPTSQPYLVTFSFHFFERHLRRPPHAARIAAAPPSPREPCAAAAHPPAPRTTVCHPLVPCISPSRCTGERRLPSVARSAAAAALARQPGARPTPLRCPDLPARRLSQCRPEPRDRRPPLDPGPARR